MDINKLLFWTGHAGFYIKADGRTIFVDPFRIGQGIKERADLVLITHPHFDHCSPEDLKRVMKAGAGIMCPRGCPESGPFKDSTMVEPGFRTEWNGVGITAIPAYNTNPARLHAHPKANRWVGYIIDVGSFRIYHAGDTDLIDEMHGMDGIGAALLPMGGTYVMDVDDAIAASKIIGAQHSIPMHYKNLLGKPGSEAAERKFATGAHNAMIMKEVQEPTYGF